MAQISEKMYQTSIACVYSAMYTVQFLRFSFRVIGMALILPMNLGCRCTVEMLYESYRTIVFFSIFDLKYEKRTQNKEQNKFPNNCRHSLHHCE